MKEKELIILAIYININGLSRQQAEQQISTFIDNYKDMYKDLNKEIKTYWFPTKEQETKVECIYPPPSIINNGYIENELLKIYKLMLSAKKEDMKDILKSFERRLKLTTLVNKMEKDDR